MRYTEKLAARIREVKSALCVGLDPRPEGGDLLATGRWLRQVVEETAPFAAAYKPNIAYFEAMGLGGIDLLHGLLKDMPEDIPVVLDAKRGDIGETQKYYARAYFEHLKVDAVTLNPFMGYEGFICSVSRPTGERQILNASAWRTDVRCIILSVTGWNVPAVKGL